MNADSITVIIPALNEEKNLENTVKAVIQAVKDCFQTYEIIVFNDNSTDTTGEIARKLSLSIPELSVVRNETSKGLGGVYKQGLNLANMNYVILVNGKNDITSRELSKIFQMRGKADIIIPYTINMNERSFFRRALSRVFTGILNTVFRMNLKYYNHSALHRTEIIKSIDISTGSYAFNAEALIKLIKKGHTFAQVAVIDKFKPRVPTKAFRLKNIIGVGLFLNRMIGEIYGRQRNQTIR